MSVRDIRQILDLLETLSSPMMESETRLRVVDINALPKDVITDICANLAERHPYFKTNDLGEQDVYDNLVGLVEPVHVLVGEMPVAVLYQTMTRNNSPATVAKYTAMLIGNPSFNFYPILTNQGKFLDGGHRLEAYKNAGRELIPVVDIGNLIAATNEKWQDWFDGDPDTSFSLK